MSEISNRPYFLRAMYEWIVDNGWTPHLQVDANWPGIQIPFEHAENGTIILNIGPNAVLGLRIENDWIHFRARFGGVEQDLADTATATSTAILSHRFGWCTSCSGTLEVSSTTMSFIITTLLGISCETKHDKRLETLV